MTGPGLPETVAIQWTVEARRPNPWAILTGFHQNSVAAEVACTVEPTTVTGALDLQAVLDALVAGNTFEVMVSNLGVVDPIANPTLAVTAVWGPVLLDQQQGEEVVGVTTYGGALRLLHVSHAPTPDLLADIKRALLGDR